MFLDMNRSQSCTQGQGPDVMLALVMRFEAKVSPWVLMSAQSSTQAVVQGMNPLLRVVADACVMCRGVSL